MKRGFGNIFGLQTMLWNRKLFSFQFQPFDCVGQECSDFCGGSHHGVCHRFANFIVVCAGFLCTCKVGFRSMSASGDGAGRQEHELAGFGVERARDVFKSHE